MDHARVDGAVYPNITQASRTRGIHVISLGTAALRAPILTDVSYRAHACRIYVHAITAFGRQAEEAGFCDASETTLMRNSL
jgi:hypothetical protein